LRLDAGLVQTGAMPKPSIDRARRLCRWLAMATWVASAALRAQPLPLFDAHLHYNAEAAAQLPPAAIVDLLRRNGVRGALLSSTPNDLTRSLSDAAHSLAIVPFVRPYRTEADRSSWSRDAPIFTMLEAEVASANYRGVGEFHVYGGDAANSIIQRIIDLAVTRGLYLMAHCDERALELILEHRPEAKLIWAHSGFTVPPEQLEHLLERHPMLLLELSYRTDITAGGRLTPAWRSLFSRFPDRFLIGSDTWTNERWMRYDEIMAWYRAWLAQLPREIAEALAWRNAETRFGR
jgi:hypothetical protein